jgi:hypothetical protein
MTDDIYDEAFFVEEETPKTLRKQVGEAIDRCWAATGQSHSLLWRKAYLALEERSGFRVPRKQLLEVAKQLSVPCVDLCAEINNQIPDYVPYQSDRSKWKCKGS